MSMVFNIARKKKAEIIPDPEPEDLSKVFYFVSEAPFSVGLYDTSVKTWNGQLQYSLDNENWTAFDPSTVATCNKTNGGKIYFRGSINTTLSGNHKDDTNDDYAFFKLTGSEIACRGNLTALLNYLLLEDDGDAASSAPSMADYCLYHLFKNCAALIEASIIIPSFIKGEQCCASMFEGCTSLVIPPTLQMTTLSFGCYVNMFDGCTSLTTAPELPATSLTYGCYNQMFQGCTSLVNAPDLPATVAVDACYGAMFNGCTSLQTSPKINLVEAAPSCCAAMFMGCSALTSVSALLPLIAYQNSYEAMFKNCTSLEMLPAISATVYYKDSCLDMFEGCTSLKVYTSSNTGYSARFSLPYTLGIYENACADNNAFTDMFKNCQTDIAKVDIETNYYTQSVYTEAESLVAEDQTKMFEFVRLGGAFTLSVAPKYVSGHTVDGEVWYAEYNSWDGNLYYKVVNSDQSESDVEWTLIDKTKDIVQIASTDTSCGRILLKGTNNHYVSTTSPGLFSLSVADSGKNIVCRGNAEMLLDADKVLAGTHPTLSGDGLKYMFARNTCLRSAPALLSTTLTESCYKSMFSSCTALLKVPALPAAKLVTACCQNMFEYCTSLKIPPALPATTLAQNCYYRMFNGCSALSALPALPARSLPTECYKEMFVDIHADGGIVTNKTTAKPARWRLPYNESSTGSADTTSCQTMFSGFTPELNTNYYTSAVVLPDGTLVTS